MGSYNKLNSGISKIRILILKYAPLQCRLHYVFFVTADWLKRNLWVVKLRNLTKIHNYIAVLPFMNLLQKPITLKVIFISFFPRMFKDPSYSPQYRHVYGQYFFMVSLFASSPQKLGKNGHKRPSRQPMESGGE